MTFRLLYGHFARKLASCNIDPRGAGRVAVALSGGPDSTALAALTARWHQDSGDAQVRNHQTA